MTSFQPTAVRSRDDCVALDEVDVLAGARERFALPRDVIYLDGNSLGPLPLATRQLLQDTVEHQWGNDLIASWNRHDWFELPKRLGDRVGELIGAAAGQVVVCDSTSINIYKAIRSAFGLNEGRSTLVTRADEFPTDLYITEGALSGVGRPARRQLWSGDVGELDALLGDDVAAVLVSQVNYRTGSLMDMRRVTEKVHDAGALVIWDLCHSAGVLPVDLDTFGVDFAIGCTYKYLNGGPGSPAFIYVNARHHEAARQPLSGWWGHATPFAFNGDYEPAAGIGRFLCGTQPVISLQGVAGGLDTYAQLSVEDVRIKSKRLGDLFIHFVDIRCDVPGLSLLSPRDSEKRGSHVSLAHDEGYALVQAMIARGVIGDFRAPDCLRFGFSPLYLRYADIWDAVEVLRQCLADEVWRDERFRVRSVVT